MTKDECEKKVKDLADKVKMADTKAKEFAATYVKRNPQFSKYKNSIYTTLKKHFFNNPAEIPEFSVIPLGNMCRIRFTPKKG